MNSGFLCPECHQDLGSVKALTDHFQRVHQAREKSTASNWLDGVLGTKKDIPSQKAISREEEERRRILEDDSAYTVSGGVNPSLWSRQEHGAQRMRMAEFRRYRDSGSDSRIVPTQSGISSLSNTICRLLDAAELGEAEKRVMEQEITPWAPDELVPVCPECGLKFGIEAGINYSRKHHCRLCGCVVCRDCCHAVLYKALADIVHHPVKCTDDASVRICNFCLENKIAELQERMGQSEISSMYLSLYNRYADMKKKLEIISKELKYRTYEPQIFRVSPKPVQGSTDQPNIQEHVDKIETDMKKLERLSKQLSSVEEIDSRLSISIRKVTQIVIQDVKFEIISNRTKIDSSSSSMASSLNSPNRTRPSTPASSNSRKSSHDHQKSFDQNPKVSKPQVSQPIYNNNDQPKVQYRLPQSGPIFQKVKTNFTCPDESSLFRSKTTDAKSTNQKPATHTESETSSNPGNPFGDFDDDEDDATSSGGNPFGEPDEPEIEEIETSGTTSGLTSGDNDERQIQIRFLEKEIRKLKIKKDFEQAEIISQVLREIIDS